VFRNFNVMGTLIIVSLSRKFVRNGETILRSLGMGSDVRL